jgi:hypothetical protein
MQFDTHWPGGKQSWLYQSYSAHGMLTNEFRITFVVRSTLYGIRGSMLFLQFTVNVHRCSAECRSRRRRPLPAAHRINEPHTSVLRTTFAKIRSNNTTPILRTGKMLDKCSVWSITSSFFAAVAALFALIHQWTTLGGQCQTKQISYLRKGRFGVAGRRSMRNGAWFTI